MCCTSDRPMPQAFQPNPTGAAGDVASGHLHAKQARLGRGGLGGLQPVGFNSFCFSANLFLSRKYFMTSHRRLTEPHRPLTVTKPARKGMERVKTGNALEGNNYTNQSVQNAISGQKPLSISRWRPTVSEFWSVNIMFNRNCGYGRHK